MDTSNSVTKRFKDPARLAWGFAFGIVFGFLLQKGGVTSYDVIIGQLLLTDFTVVKVILAAVVTGMVGVYAMKSMGLVKLHLKSGSAGQNVIGGLIFGVGFGVLGYCPGTVPGAIGNGHLDALAGGLPGILIGCGLFAAVYPRLSDGILKLGYFGDLTVPKMLKVNEWVVIVPLAVVIVGLLYWMQQAGW